jgi:hypothetical protein
MEGVVRIAGGVAAEKAVALVGIQGQAVAQALGQVRVGDEVAPARRANAYASDWLAKCEATDKPSLDIKPTSW